MQVRLSPASVMVPWGSLGTHQLEKKKQLSDLEEKAAVASSLEGRQPGQLLMGGWGHPGQALRGVRGRARGPWLTMCLSRGDR